jgi:glycerol-3-phosphate dehydrogenase
VFGGKITTFRRLAEHALRDLGRALGEPRPAWTAKAYLPGGDLPGGDFAAFDADCARRWPWLAPHTRTRMARAYGSRLERVLGEARAPADLGRDFGAGLSEREADYLRGEEWARRAEDVLWRRSKLGLHMTAEQQAAFTRWFEG